MQQKRAEADMRLRIKRILSTVLCLSMLLGMMGNISYAMDMTDNNETVVGMETEADVGFNYTYVEKPYLETPDTQNIVVSWGDGTEQISNVQIIVSSEDGITEEWACVQSIDNLYLFSKEYADETERTTYQVTDFRFIQDGEQHEISMLDLNAKVEFGVNKEYEEYGEHIIPLDIEDDVEMSVVTIDENGQTKAQKDIQTALQEATASNKRLSRARNSELVVALDPGHDDRHGGAAHNGLVEQDLTLKIAKYAKEELETYQGVRVYMTRTTSACPYPETTSSGRCIEQRMLAAARAGASIYVSIHLNATDSNAVASGAEVIYPNSNWKPQVGAEGKALAQSILNELVNLGLNNRGIYYKDSTLDNEKYDDGSKSDYFAVQIYGKEQGIPGIIVEHAFMTNASDVNNFLSTEDGLRRLGVADATGIANTYGLTKGVNVQVFDKDDFEGTCKIQISGFGDEVSVDIWNEDKPEETKYTTRLESGSVIDFNIRDYNNFRGLYHVCVYDKDQVLADTTFRVSYDTSSNLTIENIDNKNTNFKVKLSFTDMPSEIAAVQFPTWCDSQQKDIIWYNAVQSKPGVWEATVPVSNHGLQGTYNVHAYVTTNNGNLRGVANGTFFVEAPKVEVSAKAVSQDEQKYALKAENTGIAGDFQIMNFAVWSAEGGQDDLIWYGGAKDSNGDWKATAAISNHKTAGIYYVHVYGVVTTGVQKFVGSTTFEVSPASVGTLKVANYDQNAGSFDVVIDDIKAVSGVAKVQVPVWSTSNQNDIRWYEAEKQSDGSYIVHVKISTHNYNTGRYAIHMYLYTNNGLTYFKGTSQEVKEPKVTITAKDADGTEKSYRLKAENAGMAGNFQRVSFAVWSVNGGQDDIVWYSGTKDSNGDWNATAAISNHKTAGTYNVHVYGVTTAGVQKFIGNTKFEVSPVSVGTLRIENFNQNVGSFDVVVDDIKAVSGVACVRVPVWSAANQSDIRWYEAEKQSNGSYIVHVKISNHDYNVGRYYVHMYLHTNNGLTYFKGTSQEVKEPKITITAKDADGTEKLYRLKAENAGMAGNFRSVNFAVWSANGGQDDLIWYGGVKDSNGDWNATANISNHKTAGTYYVHVYGVMTAGLQKFIGSTKFEVSSASVGTLKVANYDQNAGSFNVVIDDIESASGVARVRVPVWSTSNQSDIRWYEAEKQSNGSYIVHVKISNHDYNVGRYYVHMYLHTNNGLTYFKGMSQEVKEPKITITAKDADGTEKSYRLKAENAGMVGDFRSVSFAVWSAEGGQDDLIWYGGTKDSSGDWNATATISNHKTAGTYYVHVYGVTAAGIQKFIGSTSFEIVAVRMNSIKIENYQEDIGTYDIILDITAPSGITKIQVPVWSETNQGDIKWYDAEKQNSNIYVVRVDPVNHNYNTGTYHAHIYITAGNGITIFTAADNQEVKVTEYYSIMGRTTTTVAQMVRYFESSGAIYPAEVLTKGGAKSIQEFCQIYYEEAAAEGVRAEVAFAQSMNETGFLRFGGIVQIEQFNFAGIGAVDGNASGQCASFPDVRTGVRAQIQHLKAYASKEDLNNLCVDPRFSLVTRECAPYVQWLGINENPYGKGWASAKNYGYNLVDKYICVLKQQ